MSPAQSIRLLGLPVFFELGGDIVLGEGAVGWSRFGLDGCVEDLVRVGRLGSPLAGISVVGNGDGPFPTIVYHR